MKKQFILKDIMMKRSVLFFYLILCVFVKINAQSLQDYLQIASEQSPELKSKYLEFEAAMQKIPQVGALPEPMATVGIFVNKMVPLDRARLSLSQAFPWFGTLEARKDAASAMAQVKFMAWLDARNTLFFEIRKVYYELYELEKSIAITEEKLKYFDSYEQLAQAQFQAGKGAMVDVVRVQIERNELETELKLLKDRRQPLQIILNRLLNRAENETVAVPDTLILPDLRDLIAMDSLSANPKIAMQDAERRAAELQQEAVNKERLPMVELGLQYMIMPRSERGDGNDMIMPMVGVRLPVWRSKYDAMEQEMVLMQQSAAQMKQNVTNVLASQWAEAHYNLNKARQRLDLFAKQTEATKTALDLLVAAYANSGSEFDEVLRTDQMLLQYRLMSEAARKDYLIAYARLEFLTAKNLIQ